MPHLRVRREKTRQQIAAGHADRRINRYRQRVARSSHSSTTSCRPHRSPRPTRRHPRDRSPAHGGPRLRRRSFRPGRRMPHACRSRHRTEPEPRRRADTPNRANRHRWSRPCCESTRTTDRSLPASTRELQRHREDAPGRARLREHSASRERPDGERFFAQHVRPRPQRVDRDFHVMDRRGADDHGVAVDRSEHLAVRAERWNRYALRRALGRDRVDVHHRDEPRRRRALESGDMVT
jgi:hypothetical protein